MGYRPGSRTGRVHSSTAARLPTGLGDRPVSPVAKSRDKKVHCSRDKKVPCLPLAGGEVGGWGRAPQSAAITGLVQCCSRQAVHRPAVPARSLPSPPLSPLSPLSRLPLSSPSLASLACASPRLPCVRPSTPAARTVPSTQTEPAGGGIAALAGPGGAGVFHHQ
jgi:hypothetical protein